MALLAGELQVRRAGCTACGGAKSLPQEVRQPVDGLDARTEFGDLAKHREVVAQLLVAVAVACARGGASRQRDHWRACEPGVLETSGQVGRADRLGHADARLARGAGVAIGHVRRCLLPVCGHARDAELTHGRERRRQNSWHQEHV